MKTLVGGAGAIMFPATQGTASYEVIIVDSTRLFREGLTGILEGSPFHVVAATADIDDAFGTANRAVDNPVDMVICSLDPQRSVEPQLATIRATRDRDPRTKIVLLMPACAPADLVAAVLCGVDGIILKDISGEAFRAALVLVMHGQHVLPRAVASEVFAACRDFGDTPIRERRAVPDRRAVAPIATPLAQTRISPPGAEGTIVYPSVFAAADAAAVRDRARPVVARSLGLSDPRDSDPGVSGGGLRKQDDRPQARHRRGDGQGAHQGPAPENQREQSHPGCNLGAQPDHDRPSGRR